MARQATARPDFLPHLPDLIVIMGRTWRAIRDAQTEVDPFGSNYAALDEAREAIEAVAERLTGQSGFFALAASQSSPMPTPPATLPRGGRAL